MELQKGRCKYNKINKISKRRRIRELLEMFGWLKKKKDNKPVKGVEEEVIDDNELEKEGIDPVD